MESSSDHGPRQDAKPHKRKRRRHKDHNDLQTRWKKMKASNALKSGKTPLNQLKALLERSNFYANSLLSIISEQRRKQEKQVQRKLKTRRKKLKRIEMKIAKSYKLEGRQIPDVYKTWLQSEEDQVYFGEKLCFRVAVIVSRLVRKANAGFHIKTSKEEQKSSPGHDTDTVGNVGGLMCKPSEPAEIPDAQCEDLHRAMESKIELEEMNAFRERWPQDVAAVCFTGKVSLQTPTDQVLGDGEVAINAPLNVMDVVDENGVVVDNDFKPEDSDSSDSVDKGDTNANETKTNLAPQDRAKPRREKLAEKEYAGYVKSEPHGASSTDATAIDANESMGKVPDAHTDDLSISRIAVESEEACYDRANFSTPKCAPMPSLPDSAMSMTSDLSVEAEQKITGKTNNDNISKTTTCARKVLRTLIDPDEGIGSDLETPVLRDSHTSKRNVSPVKCRRQIPMEAINECEKQTDIDIVNEISVTNAGKKNENTSEHRASPQLKSVQSAPNESENMEGQNSAPGVGKLLRNMICHNGIGPSLSAPPPPDTTIVNECFGPTPEICDAKGIHASPTIAQSRSGQISPFDNVVPPTPALQHDKCHIDIVAGSNFSQPAGASQNANASSRQDSQNSTTSSIKVPCPVCCKLFSQNTINQHLDVCLTVASRRDSLRTVSKRPSTRRNSKRKGFVSKDDKGPSQPKCSKQSVREEVFQPLIAVCSESMVETRTRRKFGDSKLVVEKDQGARRVTRSSHRMADPPIPDDLDSDDTATEHGPHDTNSVDTNNDGTRLMNNNDNNIDKPELWKLGPKKENQNGNARESCFESEKIKGEQTVPEPDCTGIKSGILQAKIISEVGKDEVPDLDNIIGCKEEKDAELEESSESENEECDANTDEAPAELRRSTRESRCRKSYKEASESEDDSQDIKTDNSQEKNVECDVEKRTKTSYSVGDVVQITWGKGEKAKPYKAKVLERRRCMDGEWTYRVHYDRWSERFDDWVFNEDINRVVEAADGQSAVPPLLGGERRPLTKEEEIILEEKFYMPSRGKAYPVSLLKEKNGMRYFNEIEVSPVQPKLLTGGALRDYQIIGYEWLRTLFENSENGILADEMGLGKTIQCIAIVCHLVEIGIRGPFLVCAPMSTIQNWFLEFRRFAPKIPLVLFHGTAEERNTLSLCILQHEKRLHIRPVVITTYDILMRDRRLLQMHKWSYLIVDEGHRIKNLKCKLLKELRCMESRGKLLLTGTPLQNNLSELWSLLHFLLPEVFDDLKTFETWFDLKRLKKDKNLLSMIHQVLTPFLLRRMKCDVNLKIPPKKEVVVYAPLAPRQERFYRALVDRSIVELLQQKEYYKTTVGVADPDVIAEQHNSQDTDPNDVVVESGRMTRSKAGPVAKPVDRSRHSVINMSMSNIIMQLRKCCNHPYLIEYPLEPGTENMRIDEELVLSSGKLMILDRLLPALKRRGHKVLLFSQMTKVLDIVEDYCGMRRFNQVRLDGQMSRNERVESMNAFNKDPDVFLFLLSTRAGGLGINLVAADTVIIYDSDWNPQNDAQAQDRCHRIGQVRPVVVYRLITASTVDQQIVERAAQKMALEKIIMHKTKFKGNIEQELMAGNKINPEELLEFLETSDTKCDINEESFRVISDEDLEKLLDRSKMMADYAQGI